MGGITGFVKSWWAQVFALLALIAILDKYTGFRTDVGALTTSATGVIGALKV